MWEVVLLTGILIVAASLYLMVRVENAAYLVDKVFATRWIYLAALFRLMLGAALIASAHTVRFSEAVNVIGWLIALGGLVLVAVPQGYLHKMGRWFVNQPNSVLRIWLILGFGFGGFMLYASLV